jgi:hypothetical protein
LSSLSRVAVHLSMTPNRPSAPGISRGKSFLLCLAVLLGVLGILFWRIFLPEYVVFSNDGPLGIMETAWNRLPAILTGMWMDQNWLGGAYPAPAPMLSTLLRLLTTPLVLSKVYAAFSVLVVGLCAWICFRQYKFSPIACLLVAVAATLNSDFFQTACWGVCSQPIAFGMNFLALGALADTTSPRRWLRVVLAGFCVGLGVMEAYDIGALFSLFVAAFVFVQSLASDGPVVKRIANGIGRLAVVSICAAFIAAAALMTLVGTQVKGVVGMGQDAESKAARWNTAVQYSIPKIETIGMIVPGLFGLRGDSPDGKNYWGRGGSDPSWDEFVESGGKRGHPQYAFRAGAGSNYAGVLVVLVALFAVAQSLRKQGGPFTGMEKKLIWFWSAAFLVGLVLMWGRFAPFYQFFYALPYASTIRNPAKFHHIVQWTLLILFAHGAEALCRIGLNSTATAASGLSAQWRNFWGKATSFDRKWIAFSAMFVGVFVLGWLVYASSRGKLENHLVELNRLQFLAQPGVTPEMAANAAANTIESARLTARFSVARVGRTLLFIIPTAALLAIILSGYFRGARAKVGGGLMLILLIVDLLPFDTAWVVMVNWKQKYESNSVMEFLKERPYEHRIARFPMERFVDMDRLPPQVKQQTAFFSQLYGVEWTQHLFPYNNIQSLDIIQEPRVATDKAAYEAVMFFAPPLRRWELSNTRFLLGPAGLLDMFNQQLDAGKGRFQIAHQFDLGAKPGSSGQRLEDVTTSSRTNGQFTVYDFLGALPRVKLYANWKVSTNETSKLEEWSKGIQQRVPKEWASALAVQTPAELATLHELADPAFDPAQSVLLTQPMKIAPGTNQNPGEVKFESYAPKRIVLIAKANAPCVLLLNDKFDPNWHVTVDGQPSALLRCNYIVRGVFLDKAGEHRVEFKFQPPLTGLYVSTVALVIGLAVLGYVAFTGRKQPGSVVETDTKKK